MLVWLVKMLQAGEVRDLELPVPHLLASRFLISIGRTNKIEFSVKVIHPLNNALLISQNIDVSKGMANSHGMGYHLEALNCPLAEGMRRSVDRTSREEWQEEHVTTDASPTFHLCLSITKDAEEVWHAGVDISCQLAHGVPNVTVSIYQIAQCRPLFKQAPQAIDNDFIDKDAAHAIPAPTISYLQMRIDMIATVIGTYSTPQCWDYVAILWKSNNTISPAGRKGSSPDVQFRFNRIGCK